MLLAEMVHAASPVNTLLVLHAALLAEGLLNAVQIGKQKRQRDKRGKRAEGR